MEDYIEFQLQNIYTHLPLYHDATIPRCHNTTMPRCHNARMPLYRNATMPRCHNAMMPTIPQFHNAMMPRCTSHGLNHHKPYNNNSQLFILSNVTFTLRKFFSTQRPKKLGIKKFVQDRRNAIWQPRQELTFRSDSRLLSHKSASSVPIWYILLGWLMSQIFACSRLHLSYE